MYIDRNNDSYDFSCVAGIAYLRMKIIKANYDALYDGMHLTAAPVLQ